MIYRTYRDKATAERECTKQRLLGYNAYVVRLRNRLYELRFW